MNDLRIKTCPHCGGRAGLFSRYTYRGGYYVFVQCNVCKSSGKLYLTKADPDSNNWSSSECYVAVEAWNMETERHFQ